MRLVVAAAAALLAATPGPARDPAASQPCDRPVSAAYAQRVTHALRAGRDVWGEALLATPVGPTYEGVRRYLNPLFLARRAGRRPLTATGAHYVALGQPLGPHGAGSVALHVADGSQILSDRATGRRLTVRVGGEVFGSCRARLTGPALRDGHLPVIRTGYVARSGTRYEQESFAARIPQTRWLVSFVSVTAETGDRASEIGFTPSTQGLRASGTRLVRGAATHLYFGEGGRLRRGSLVYSVPPRSRRTVHVAWVNYPRASRPLRLDAAAHEAARRSAASYWTSRLAAGAAIRVPDERVVAAERNLLVQNLNHAWRYSFGNQYEQFSFPESVDVAQVMSEWGFGAVGEAILRTSLTRRATPYPSWKMGEKLLGSARYYELHRRRGYVARATPELASYVSTLGRQLERSPRGLLDRERFSSDIPDAVYGLHAQAVVWQGLLAMGRVWSQTGRAGLARRCAALAARLGAGLRRAVAASQRRLPDGSLFVPMRLLDGERPYRSVTESRRGSYWNLVAPYAFASGLLPPGGAQAEGALRYLDLHGARLLGLVRAGAFSLYGRSRRFPTGGTDHVYGINAARFLADNDRADRLLLSLYGHLAAGMAESTFVSGEAASVRPIGRTFLRSMYLPPNGASNAAFLATLRLLLVHETRDGRGAPLGLRLAHATARPWLEPGRRIEVERMPTSFGSVSFTLAASERSVRAVLDVPARPAPRRLALRLRLPRPSRILRVTVDGRPHDRFDPRSETIDLSGRSGRLEVVVEF